jgi:hypothetical protein
LRNLMLDGSLCQREQLIDFIQGNHKSLDFDNRKQYFTSKEYHEWLRQGKNLDNIFFVCYSLKQTKMCVFTGNKNRFLNGINFIDYELLRPDNLVEAILCSSSLIGFYPLPNINRDKAIDGAAAEINQSVHLYILFNVSNYISSSLLYTPELLFFGITPEKNDNFTIIINKINIQHRYEDLIEYDELPIPILNSLNSLLTLQSRKTYNSETNVPLMSLFLTQPHVVYFSVNNITNNILGALKQKDTILRSNKHTILSLDPSKRIPTFLLNMHQFESDIFGMKRYFKTYKKYKKAYNKYNIISSNLVYSTHLHKKHPPETIKLLDKNYTEHTDVLTLNVCIFDTFVRHTYDFSLINLNIEMLTNTDTGSLEILKKLGAIMGNMMYDVHIRQSLTTSTTGMVSCGCLKPFARDINEIMDKAYRGFLGPNQS